MWEKLFAVVATLLLTACARGGVRGSLDAGPGGPGPSVDAGAPSPGYDAGVRPTDAGEAPSDAGAPATDAGPGAGLDAGSPPAGCTALPESGSATLTGTTSGAPSWERPFADGCPATSRSVAGSSVPRATHVLCNGVADGVFDLTLSGSIDDSYLIVYDGAGLPADELACRDGDDDGAGDGQAAIRGLAVGASETVTVVVTGFGNSDWGSYQLTVARR